jgi:hypothetical protein
LRHGTLTAGNLATVLADRGVVRYPVELCFGTALLQRGEFAWPEPRGEHPADGFRLWVHPRFRSRPEALPLLVAYQLVSVNYGEIATAEVAEAFGSAACGLSAAAYYEAICALADEVEGGADDGTGAGGPCR